MASIIIDNLSNYNVSGSELFNDSENFMQELTENELLETIGGTSPTIVSVVSVVALSVSVTASITITYELAKRRLI
jgi:hypothetical protein